LNSILGGGKRRKILLVGCPEELINAIDKAGYEFSLAADLPSIVKALYIDLVIVSDTLSSKYLLEVMEALQLTKYYVPTILISSGGCLHNLLDRMIPISDSTIIWPEGSNDLLLRQVHFLLRGAETHVVIKHPEDVVLTSRALEMCLTDAYPQYSVDTFKVVVL